MSFQFLYNCAIISENDLKEEGDLSLDQSWPRGSEMKRIEQVASGGPS